MKKLLLLMLALSIPLAQVARAENDNKERKRHKRAAEEQQAPATSARPGTKMQRTARGARPATAVKSEATLDGRTRQATVTRRTTSQAVAARPTRSFNRDSFAVARTRVVRVAHPAWWWRGHFPHTTFVLFGGGYYYWWGGYWYPAYGYSPIYNSYTYAEPIYGYNNLQPGQVIENVQVALRDQGYYPGAIDGLIGTQTRSALATYQRDHGLVVTSAIDEPTLVTLGLA
jgi:Putative peptidoglycan binding domain